MTPTLPGLIGPAPPTAKSPPGTSPPRGTGTTDGTGFAGAMAAARARTSTQGDAKEPANTDPPGDAQLTSDAKPATTNEGTTPATAAFDLAHLLLGLLPGVGKAGTTATPGTTTASQPDRPAGAGNTDQTGVREAYQALMALLLTGSQTTQAPPPTADAGATLTGARAATTAGGVSGIVAELVQLLQDARSAPPPAGQAAGQAAATGQDPAGELAQLLATAQQASQAGDGIDLSSIVAELRKQAVSQGGSGERTAALRAVETRGPAAPPAQQAGRPQGAGPADGALGTSLRALADAVSAVAGRGATGLGSTSTAPAAAVPGAPTGAAKDAAGPVIDVAKKPAAELQAQLVGAGQAPAPAHAPSAPSVSGADAPVPAHDPAAFVARVADVVQHAVLVGDREVRLVLNPPELGHLTVHIQDTAQGVRVMLQASTADAHDLLQQQLPQLQSALQSRDLRLDRLQVGYTSAALSQGALDGGGAAFQGGNRRGSQDQGTPSWSPVAALGRVESASSATIERATAARPPVRDGGVDLKA